jgi:hypothetical protein
MRLLSAILALMLSGCTVGLSPKGQPVIVVQPTADDIAAINRILADK